MLKSKIAGVPYKGLAEVDIHGLAGAQPWMHRQCYRNAAGGSTAAFRNPQYNNLLSTVRNIPIYLNTNAGMYGLHMCVT